MLLADWEIRQAVAHGELGIAPFDPAAVQPASYDLRLAEGLLVLEAPLLDSRQPQQEAWRRVEGRAYQLAPGRLYLAATLEAVRLPRWCAGVLAARSSLARMGVRVVGDAGFVDPGFFGQLTLELEVVGPARVVLYAGQRVAQLALLRLSAPAERPYLGRYQGAAGPQPSRAWLDAAGEA